MSRTGESETPALAPASFAVKTVPSRASHWTRIGWCSTRSIGRPSVRIIARGPWRDGRRQEEHIAQVPLSQDGKLDARTERRLFGRLHAYLVRIGHAEDDIEPIKDELRDRLVARGMCEPQPPGPDLDVRPTGTEVRQMVARVAAKLRVRGP